MSWSAISCLFHGFTLSRIHFPTSSGVAIHSSTISHFFTVSSFAGFISHPSVSDAGSFLVIHSYAFHAHFNTPATHTLPTAHSATL
jgi:hypothetical protein